MIKLLFAGDFIPPETSQNLYSQELKKILQDKDFSIVNLETPLTRSTKKIKKTGNNFKRHPESVKHIKDGYWDAVALSNNHIRDYGDKGVLDTMETCKQNNVLTVGAGENLEVAAKPLRLNIKDKKISILNYSEREFNIAGENFAGANPFDLIDAFHQVREEKKWNDFVFVIYHGGLEYHHVPLPGIKKNLEFIIDSGADAVVCHHSHYIGGYSIYKNRPIFYSMGNFYLKYKSRKLLRKDNLHKGLLLKLLIDSDNGMTFELMGISKAHDQSKIYLISFNSKYIEIDSPLEHFNEIINSRKSLEQYWKMHYKNYRLKYYSSIKFSNYIISKFFKKFGTTFSINPYYLRKVSNSIRCDSHREMIVRAFSDESAIL